MKAVIQLGEALACVAFYLIRKHNTYTQEGYGNFETYAKAEHGLKKDNAYKVAQAGEMILRLYPNLALHLEAKQPPDSIQIGYFPIGSPGALRPLLELVRAGFSDEELRDAWAELLEHVAEPTVRRVEALVQEKLRVASTGKGSPVGAEAMRQAAARAVYSVLTHMGWSDGEATHIRELVLNELYDMAADEQYPERDVEE